MCRVDFGAENIAAPAAGSSPLGRLTPLPSPFLLKGAESVSCRRCRFARFVVGTVRWGRTLPALTAVHKIITAPDGSFWGPPPGRFGTHPDTATRPTQNCAGTGIHRPAGRSGGAARADPAVAPAAGLVGSGPRPGREPNRASDGAPASPRTGRIWKICAARADRAPSVSRYGRRLD